MTERHLLGAAAEAAAAAWLQSEGWDVLARNWRCPGGELDVVCRRLDTVAFVEVRALSRRDALVQPQQTVTAAKCKRLTAAALRWLADHPQPRTVWRFDIIAAHPDPSASGGFSLRRFPNAFTPRQGGA
jgi:putative endonuclease